MLSVSAANMGAVTKRALKAAILTNDLIKPPVKLNSIFIVSINIVLHLLKVKQWVGVLQWVPHSPILKKVTNYQNISITVYTNRIHPFLLILHEYYLYYFDF